MVNERKDGREASPAAPSRFHVERLREVWDKVNPEGAGALSYAALKRTLDDLEIDWVRTARPSSERRVESPRVANISPPSLLPRERRTFPA